MKKIFISGGGMLILSGVSGPEAPHVTENVGSKTIKFIVVELKDRPYKAEK